MGSALDAPVVAPDDAPRVAIESVSASTVLGKGAIATWLSLLRGVSIEDHARVTGIGTCRRAVTLGYDVTLLEDGHSTFDSAELAAPAVIAHHHRILDGFGAYVAGRPCEVRVVASDAVVFEVPPPSEED